MNKNQNRAKNEPAENSGILKGVGDLIDDGLEEKYIPGLKKIRSRAPHYRWKGASKELVILSVQEATADFEELLKGMLKRIEDTFKCSACKYPDRSDSNWTIRREVKWLKRNPSPEKVLEKKIAKSRWPVWGHQVPVASGYISSTSDRKRDIDLCLCLDGGTESGCRRFAFLELKCERKGGKYDSPLRAAFEIVEYGLLYLFTRGHASFPKYQDLPLMRATHVLLGVLTPKGLYKDFATDKLQRVLDHAVRECARPKLNMGFRFLEFPDNFRWPCEPRNAPGADELAEAVKGLENKLRGEQLWQELEQS